MFMIQTLLFSDTGRHLSESKGKFYDLFQVERACSERVTSASAIFQVLSAQNKQYAIAVYSGWGY